MDLSNLTGNATNFQIGYFMDKNHLPYPSKFAHHPNRFYEEVRQAMKKSELTLNQAITFVSNKHISRQIRRFD